MVIRSMNNSHKSCSSSSTDNAAEVFDDHMR
jgi:hypothetical protein